MTRQEHNAQVEKMRLKLESFPPIKMTEKPPDMEAAKRANREIDSILYDRKAGEK